MPEAIFDEGEDEGDKAGGEASESDEDEKVGSEAKKPEDAADTEAKRSGDFWLLTNYSLTRHHVEQWTELFILEQVSKRPNPDEIH